MRTEASPIGGALVADDVGLGKTVTALLLVTLSADFRASSLPAISGDPLAFSLPYGPGDAPLVSD